MCHQITDSFQAHKDEMQILLGPWARRMIVLCCAVREVFMGVCQHFLEWEIVHDPLFFLFAIANCCGIDPHLQKDFRVALCSSHSSRASTSVPFSLCWSGVFLSFFVWKACKMIFREFLMRSGLFCFLRGQAISQWTDVQKSDWCAGACGATSHGLSHTIFWSYPTTLELLSAGMSPKWTTP